MTNLDTTNIDDDAAIETDDTDADIAADRVSELEQRIIELRFAMIADDVDDDTFDDLQVERAEAQAELKDAKRNAFAAAINDANAEIRNAVIDVLNAADYATMLGADVTNVVLTLSDAGTFDVNVNADVVIKRTSGTRGKARPLKAAFELFATTEAVERVDRDVAALERGEGTNVATDESEADYKKRISYVEYLERDKLWNTLSDSQKTQAEVKATR